LLYKIGQGKRKKGAIFPNHTKCETRSTSGKKKSFLPYELEKKMGWRKKRKGARKKYAYSGSGTYLRGQYKKCSAFRGLKEGGDVKGSDSFFLVKIL